MWTRNYVSLGGILTLNKATLSNLPFMSLIQIPALVANKLERLRETFYGKETVTEKRYNWSIRAVL